MRSSFLFWNVNKKPLERIVAALVVEHGIDILILAECDVKPLIVIEALDAAGATGFKCPPTLAGKETDLKVFTKGGESMLQHLEDDPNDHLTIRRLWPQEKHQILLVAVHFQSKMSYSDVDQSQLATRLRPKIEGWENRYAIRRTVVVGDLNMNPFEGGVVSSEGLHGVMTKQIARSRNRTVAGEQRLFFYNPMWRFFGDQTDGPPGTYYYSASGQPLAYHWNIFDQVLVRPDLMDDLEQVKILDRVDGSPLVNQDGLPEQSDHLPVFFVLNLE